MFDILKSDIISAFTPGEKVMVAMSGGVDSSIVAWAAVEAGCDVMGVTLKLYNNSDDTVSDEDHDAKKVADKLGIDWVMADYRSFFGEDVISPYISMYRKGKTPNPCSLCNRVGKTKYLFDQMCKIDASRIATGHYASIVEYNDSKSIGRAISKDKDQSYYLSLMDPFHIELMTYPLAKVPDKELLRSLANELGLPIAYKKDSFEACFLQGEDYRAFISDKIGLGKQGVFTLHGKEVGKHKGTFNYTIGQRRGLDVSHTEPLYVKYIDINTGEIQLAEKEHVFYNGVRLENCILNHEKILFKGVAKLRYRMKDATCTVEVHQGRQAIVLFDEAQFAPAPGQVTTIYDGDRVVGGGIVESFF